MSLRSAAVIAAFTTMTAFCTAAGAAGTSEQAFRAELKRKEAAIIKAPSFSERMKLFSAVRDWASEQMKSLPKLKTENDDEIAYQILVRSFSGAIHVVDVPVSIDPKTFSSECDEYQRQIIMNYNPKSVALESTPLPDDLDYDVPVGAFEAVQMLRAVCGK